MTTAPRASAPLLLALRRLRTAVATRDRVAAEAAGLREVDLTVLEVLNREGPHTPTALARRTSTPLATMTGVLSRLEAGGWIERRPHASDRRSIWIHSSSVDRFNELYAESTERILAVFDRWPAEQTRAFLRVTTRIAEALEPPSGAAEPPRGTASGRSRCRRADEESEG